METEQSRPSPMMAWFFVGFPEEGFRENRNRDMQNMEGKALSHAQAALLRQRAQSGEEKALLAREFGISRETVYQYFRSAS